MHDRSEEFSHLARGVAGFEPDILELPEGTHTAADAAAAVDCDLEQISKSMVMQAGDDLVLVLTSGPHRVDEAALGERLGVERVSPADPADVKETLGWSIGGVPPFAHDTAIETYIDPTLLEHDEVWSGAGTPYAVFPIDPQELKRLAGAEEIDAFEDA